LNDRKFDLFLAAIGDRFNTVWLFSRKGEVKRINLLEKKISRWRDVSEDKKFYVIELFYSSTVGVMQISGFTIFFLTEFR